MENYRAYLPELKSMTLFQGIEDELLIQLLEVMQPAIIRTRKDQENKAIRIHEGWFNVCLKEYPALTQAPRDTKYAMPKIGEPGMMMGEIPALSEMKFPNGFPPKNGKKPVHPQRSVDEDCLEMNGEMITKFYSDEVYPAQSKMLRNFLGILAQKVTDIRHDNKLREDLLQKQIEGEVLFVNSAGCVGKLVTETAVKWNKLHPELPAVVKMGGSVDIVRNAIAGKPCDLMLVADESNISEMMMPVYADGYYVFAGNKMVITGHGINSNNWREKLLAPNATFMHFSPYGDPGGYRAVMAMLLADEVEPGLSKKLMEHPGHIGMEKEAAWQETDYMFSYYSGPASQGVEFAELPAVMDLSDESLADVYAKVQFAVDDEHIVTGKPIAHALTIPFAAKHKKEAKEFAELFLQNDFAAKKYIPKQRKEGNWR